MRLIKTLVIPVLMALSLGAQEPGMSGLWHQTRVDNIPAAIETCISDMFFIKRPIARRRLANVNPAYKKIALSITPQQVSVKLDDRNPILMPASGQAVSWTREDGEVFQVAAHLAPNQLTQTFKNEDGERTNIFRLSPDGKSINLFVTVNSPQLPKALTYTITFGR